MFGSLPAGCFCVSTLGFVSNWFCQEDMSCFGKTLKLCLVPFMPGWSSFLAGALKCNEFILISYLINILFHGCSLVSSKLILQKKDNDHGHEYGD